MTPGFQTWTKMVENTQPLKRKRGASLKDGLPVRSSDKRQTVPGVCWCLKEYVRLMEMWSGMMTVTCGVMTDEVEEQEQLDVSGWEHSGWLKKNAFDKAWCGRAACAGRALWETRANAADYDASNEASEVSQLTRKSGLITIWRSSRQMPSTPGGQFLMHSRTCLISTTEHNVCLNSRPLYAWPNIYI